MIAELRSLARRDARGVLGLEEGSEIYRRSMMLHWVLGNEVGKGKAEWIIEWLFSFGRDSRLVLIDVLEDRIQAEQAEYIKTNIEIIERVWTWLIDGESGIHSFEDGLTQEQLNQGRNYRLEYIKNRLEILAP